MQYVVLAALLFILVVIQMYLSQKEKPIYGISSLIGFSVWNIAFTIVIILTAERLSSDVVIVFIEMIAIIFLVTIVLAITHILCRKQLKKEKPNKSKKSKE